MLCAGAIRIDGVTERMLRVSVHAGDHVENNAALPPSQCIPKGGVIAASPSEPGRCADLFVP
jgi:hypothetical protein